MQGRAIFGNPESAVWHPGPAHLARSTLAAAMRKWGFESLETFHTASVENPEWFWPAVAEDLGVRLSETLLDVCDESAGRAFPRWFSGQSFNVVWGCVQRHAVDPDCANKAAVIYEGDSGQQRSLTYAQLKVEVDRFASVLTELGIGKGDRVALFMPPLPEASVAVLGAAKIGAVIVPAFSGYGSEALANRLNASEATLVVTVNSTTRRGKTVDMKAIVDKAADLCPTLEHVLVVRSSDQQTSIITGRDHWWDHALSQVKSETAPAVALDPNDPLFIIYTSGTTGAPKGIVHSQLGYLLKAAIDFGYAFDVQKDDVVAWIADMGWNLGPLMIMGGLHFGATMVFVEGVPDYPQIDRLWKIVERHKATLLGLAPSAARGMRVALNGGRPAADLSSLRAFASTGEAWDLPSWNWLFQIVGGSQLPILNYTGGTEVGGGILSCYTIAPQSPASFSGPLPGMAVDVFDSQGEATPDIGELVILNTWPGMAHSFWKDDDRFLKAYWQQWDDVWVHGDLASVDSQGYWHIHGRSDDTLKIGGRRVGPAEIESALVAQTGVAEAAVIGVPDDLKGQSVVAFVVAAPGQSLDSHTLTQGLIQSIGKGMTPSRIHIVAALPKTKNGKILRRGIRAQYLGKPTGDMSALDPLTPLTNIPALG